MKYYPPLSQLIGREALPSDIGILASATETAQDILDQLLSGIRYKNLIINQSADGDVRFYSLVIVKHEFGIKLPGADISLLFFPGAAGSGEANIPLGFEWRWGVKRYVNDFETAIFSRSPQAFFDIFLKVANVSEAQFVDTVIKIFVGDPDPYVKLVEDIKTYVSDYKNRTVLLEDAEGEIFAKADDILTRLGTLIADLQNPSPAFDSAVDYIVDSFESIANTLDLDLNLVQLAFETVTRDVTDIDEKLEKLRILFGSWFGGLTWQHVEELLIPQFSLTVTDIPMALEFPRKWLVPLKADNTPDPDVKVKSRLTCQVGSVIYSTKTGLTFVGENSFDFTKSMIGKTGLTLEIDDARIDFSRTTNIPEADAAGYPVDFVGVFVKFIEIGLPQKWFSTPTGSPAATLAIVGRELLLGTGGPTGIIGLETLVLGKPDPNGPQPPAAGAEIEFILGKKPPTGQPRKGFKLGFSSFDMKFRHGALLESKIKGSMTIPKFQAGPLGIELFIAQDGDFEVTASVPGAGHPFTIPNVFTFLAKSLSIGKDDNRVFAEVTGDLSFQNNAFIGNIIKDPIHIEKLRINGDGSFEIEGGSIPLPESIPIPLSPAKIAITAIHCGKHEQDHDGRMRQYGFWGFDAGISINPGGINASGDGIKYYYTVDDDETGLPHHHFLRIEGMGIDLCIPGDMPKEKAALLLKGYLSLKEEVYKGSLSIQLPQLKIAGSASMEYYTRIPAWFVEAKLSLSTPILMAASTLGIYDFAGLFGWRYVAAKEAVNLDEEASWGDYYRAPPGKGVSLDKFLKPDRTEGASNPFSIGAGVGLATTPNDRAFSAQLFLLVSIPNLILLEGRGDVGAQQRVGPSDDPPYYAYLALSPDSIEIGAGAHYMVPKSTGKVLDLNATLEAAFFFNNASAWYVNFGTKAKPMTARVLLLFDAYAYLMFAASGIEAGTGVHYDFDKEYGPLSVRARAYLDLWAYLSFERGQAGGGIALGGYVDIRVLGIGFHIEIATGLTVDAPKPFRVAGYVHVCVSINLRIKKFTKCVDVAFVWVGDTNPDLTQIPVLPAPSTALPFAAGVHMASGRTYELQVTDTELAPEAISNEVPLDTYIDLKLLKPVDPSSVTTLGGRTNAPSGNVELIPPRNGWKTVTHSYKLEELRLETWSSKKPGWITYHPFLALTQGALLSAADAAKLSGFPIGSWQKQDKGYSQIRILALTPFNYMEPVGGYRPEQMGLTAATLFCEGASRTETCVKFDIAEGEAVPPLWMHFVAGVDYCRHGLLFRIEGEDTASVPIGTGSAAQVMLAIKPGSRAILQFPQAVVRCRLELISGAPSVTVRFQQRKPNAAAALVSLPEFVDVKTLVAAPDALTGPIVYNDPARPIDRVIVEPPRPDDQAIASLQDEIARLREASPAVREIDALQQKLGAEHGKFCGGSLGGAGPPEGEECATYLDQVCWLTEEDWAFNLTIPSVAAVEANFQTMRDAVEKTIAPILHPNQPYRVVVKVSDTVNGSINTTTRYVQFRTGGALGFFDPNPGSPPPPGPDDERAEVPERFLKFYIDMERSDPDPSGNLLYAKPLYYGAPVLRLFFTKPYAYHFFAKWPAYHSPPNSSDPAELDPDHYELVMRIKDPAQSQPASNAPDHAAPLVTEALTGVQSWNLDPAPRRTEDLKVLSNMRNPLLGGVDPGPTCWTVGGDPITPAAKSLQVELHDLEPNKLYTAVLINRHAEAAGGFSEAEVGRFPFPTSIYRDFQSHIGSYRLNDEEGNTRPAVFVVNHNLAGAATAPQTYAAARNILQCIGAADADSAAYPDFFDRLIYACLKLEPLAPARTLEFNFVRNALTQQIYAMWIRSPEALNNPRLSRDQLRSAIRLFVGGSELLSPNVLFSRDCCQAFVMTAADAFPSQDIAFQFALLVWDEQAHRYIAKETIATESFSSP
jgi:hypothetical protein